MPIWHPISKDAYSKLIPAPITKKPSEIVLAQEQWVKLFYARYFDVTPAELAISFGTSPLPLVGTKQHITIRKSLDQIWKALRLRAFGAKSPLSQLVQHKVEEFDFMATLTELFRMEIVLNRVPVGGETPNARQLRLSMATEYTNLKDEHIRRMDHSMAEAVANATRALNLIRSGAHNALKSSRIREARATLEFREQAENDWKSKLDDLKSWTNPVGHGPAENTYAYLASDCQQAFWERVWSKDVAVIMLAGLNNVIDIPATLEHSEDMYQAAFMAYAMNAWQYCLGVEYESRVATDALLAAGIQGGVIEMAGESLRPQVYANMSGTIRALFEDTPGEELDHLRIAHALAPARPKRKLVEVKVHEFAFLAKKRRT
jgi:hypothetical protein